MSTKLFCSNPLKEFSYHKKQILDSIEKICESESYILGEEVAIFESEFAAYNQVKYSVGVGSGTDAIILALKSLDIGQGDEIITVSHTAVATIAAINLVGAKPVLVDIEPSFYTIDPDKIEQAITSKTKAILPVHLYGLPCEMNRILDIAKRFDLKVIEDCAQAHGALYNGNKVGTFGDIGCFSFYPTKNLGGIGDGGCIITNNKMIADRIKGLRQYGWNDQRISQEPGVVSRLDEIQAAILRVKLKYLDHNNALRRKLAVRYLEQLNSEQFILPKERINTEHVYHLFVIRAMKRDRLIACLAKKNIFLGIHYPYPAHLHPAYSRQVKMPDSLSTTLKIVNEIVSLPIYPNLENEAVDMIIRYINEYSLKE